jgi:hypothetical protein
MLDVVERLRQKNSGLVTQKFRIFLVGQKTDEDTKKPRWNGAVIRMGLRRKDRVGRLGNAGAGNGRHYRHIPRGGALR